jgi:Trk K+ transport system NAD-binding subunit
MTSPIFIALRRLRPPLLVLIAVYAAGIVGFVLIPGQDAEGRPAPMSIFHAFYFITYTASTIGFGELPHAFTDAQRLWATVVIYLSVIGWAYTIGALLALGRDRGFRQALRRASFAGEVRGRAEPFYIVCGYGETGALICNGLDRSNLRFVVVEVDEARVAEVDLAGFTATTPAIQGDARLPENLLAAGLRHSRCRGVLAVTDDDEVNLAVAIAVRLLNPRIPVLARARSEEIAENMRSFHTDHVINPFTVFGEYLSLLLRAPRVYELLDRLIGSAASPETTDRLPPRGRWVVCGYGRFGREVVQCFDREGLDITIIDPDPPADADRPVVRGTGTNEGPLRAAGIERAVGIVAGTDNDINNLSIAVTARNVKPDLYVIVRQNHTANAALFQAFGADYTVVSRAIVAEHCIALVRTPLLAPFIARVTRGEEAAGAAALTRLDTLAGAQRITAWSVRVSAAGAPAIHRALMVGHATIHLGELLRDPAAREQPLCALALLLARGDATTLLPPDDTELRAGDELLLAGSNAARERLQQTLQNENVRDYVLLGRDIPGGLVWQRFGKRATPV